MIIISQDKRKIVNFENIKTIELDRETNFTSIIIFRETARTGIGVCGLYIGHYKTEERAKEVLEEMTEYYKKFEYCKQITIGQKYDDTRKNELGVYEMPKE